MIRVPEGPRRHRLWLLLGLETYLTATFLVYLVGPFAFAKPNAAEVAMLVLVYQGALLLGFLLAERFLGHGTDRPIKAPDWGGRGRLVATIGVGELLSLVFSYGSLASYAQSWNPVRVLDALIRSIQSPGAAYVANHAASSNAGTLLTKSSTLAAPLTFATLVIGLYFWRKLPRVLQIIVVLDVFMQLLTAVIRGVNFGVFKVTAVVLTVALLMMLRGARRRRLDRKAFYARVAGAALIVSMFVGYFVVNTGDRMTVERPASRAGVSIDYNSPLVKVLPEGAQSRAILVYMYLGEGYYGLSIAVDYPFMSTFGLGNSVFLMDNAKRAFGWDLFPRTYVHRMDSEWSESQNWHTAYTWFANDVGLGGVVGVMLLLGVLLNVVLRGAMRRDLLAIAVLPLYLMMVIFLPANNVVMSNPLTCMPLVVITGTYVVVLVRRRQAGGRAFLPWGRTKSVSAE